MSASLLRLQLNGGHLAKTVRHILKKSLKFYTFQFLIANGWNAKVTKYEYPYEVSYLYHQVNDSRAKLLLAAKLRDKNTDLIV